jgi:hypothetical protein
VVVGREGQFDGGRSDCCQIIVATPPLWRGAGFSLIGTAPTIFVVFKSAIFRHLSVVFRSFYCEANECYGEEGISSVYECLLLRRGAYGGTFVSPFPYIGTVYMARRWYKNF